MTASAHYRSNLRDTFFNLFEFQRIQDTCLGKGPYTSHDEESARQLLSAVEEAAQRLLAPTFHESDQTPLTLSNGNVTLPPGLTSAMRAYQDSDFHKLEIPEHLGGLGAPPSVTLAALEFVAGANSCVAFYLFGSFIAKVIDRLGTPEQKARFCLPMVEGRWGGTMILTEPDAGSDVGAGKTRAVKADNGEWHITGVKRFITSGDFDLPDNIVHLVLARPEGAGPGTKGLSLFIVPKFWVNPDGSRGERNGVVCTNLEKKMGIKASATAEMTFGDGKPARGLLMGEVHDGIRQMFQVIEQARMAIGIKSMSTLSTAYLNALAYAQERVQGPDLAKANDKASPRVRIIDHPDVRRMLMQQKAHAEGMRALVFFTASIQDQVEILGGHGAKESERLDHLNDLLLPLVKGYNSEKAYELLAVSLQCFGGSGYCQDYPIEQYIRDQKIDTLYEGTTHIQALDLLFRKVARDGGQTLQSLFGRIQKTLEEKEGGDSLTAEREALTRALADVQGMYLAMMGKLKDSVYHAGFQGNRMLMATAELVIGWLLVRSAAVAEANKAKRPEEAAFYDGKIASARFFCSDVLPRLTLERKMVEKSSIALMSVAEASF